MKQITLTRGKAALVDDDMYIYLNQWKWHAIKGRNTFYAARHIIRNGKRGYITMQHDVLSDKKGFIIDHIDQNGLNNLRRNLRRVNIRGNSLNSCQYKNNKSGFRGVYKHRKSWRADKTVYGHTIHLGSFQTKEDAAMAYIAAR